MTMTSQELTKDALEANRLQVATEKPAARASLLDKLCGSSAVAVSQDGRQSIESVPPTGINDLGDLDDCWVARAVYGEDNPRWMHFRAWLRGEAPAWFRRLYVRHGQRFARWIAPHEGVKSVIRRWMDARIGPI